LDIILFAFTAAYLVVPLLLLAATTVRTAVVAGLGVVAFAVEWGLAFDAAQDGAGDHRGAAALFFTGTLGLIFYGGLWAAGMLVGWVIRERRRRPEPARSASA
jgi:hypothetical protein